MPRHSNKKLAHRARGYAAMAARYGRIPPAPRPRIPMAGRPSPRFSPPGPSSPLREQLFASCFAEPRADEDEDVIFISKGMLHRFTLHLCCKECGGVTEPKFRRVNFDTFLEAYCSICDEDVAKVSPRQEKQGRQVFTHVNVKMIYQALINNLGRAGLSRIAGTLGVTPFSCSRFNSYAKFLYSSMEKHYAAAMETAIRGIFQHYEQTTGELPDPNGFLNIDVTFHGTWMTKGTKCNVGVAVLIEVATGIPVDFEVLSNFCPSCTKKKLSPAAYATWKKEHEATCCKNYDGSSEGMEAAAAVRLWSRSQQHGLRYTTLVGDGESPAYSAVSSMNEGAGPYDVPVVKEECIRYVRKRKGKLKKEQVTAAVTKSFLAKIWTKCSKEKFACPSRVRFCAQVTVLEHIFGYEKCTLMTYLGFSSTDSSLKVLHQQEVARLTSSKNPIKRRKMATEESD